MKLMRHWEPYKSSHPSFIEQKALTPTIDDIKYLNAVFNLIVCHSSFPMIHKVGNVVNFVLLHSEG